VTESPKAIEERAGKSSRGAQASAKAWSVAEAKAKLSEILRRARGGEPQTIGAEDPCVVVSASDFQKYWRSEHLGRFLVESAPGGGEFELPSRAGDRADPLAAEKDERAA
jgi:prevent-host-death family protein